jgi:hypothetical protein
MGGICISNNGTISHCINNGSVSGVDMVAGIASDNGFAEQIINCINTGKITATNSGNNDIFSGVAGIVAVTQGGSTTNCINLGDIEGQGFVGGIQGLGYGSSPKPAIITNCVNAGYVKGTSQVGGILGIMFNPGVIITNCVNVGVVEGNEDVGSIVGKE